MLERAAADTELVVHRILVLIALSCSALVIASFGLFARDQIAGASQHQVSELASSPIVHPAPTSTHHAQPRRFIDGAWTTLTSPFSSIVQSEDQWVVHGLPTVFALLVYGLGIGYLARFTRGLA
jgi:hypothetical protein